MMAINCLKFMESKDWSNTMMSILAFASPNSKIFPYLIHGDSTLKYVKWYNKFSPNAQKAILSLFFNPCSSNS